MSEPKQRWVNIYNDPNGGRFISDVDYESLSELENVMDYRIDKEFVVETVRLVSKEEIAELQRKADLCPIEDKLRGELTIATTQLDSLQFERENLSRIEVDLRSKLEVMKDAWRIKGVPTIELDYEQMADRNKAEAIAGGRK